MSNEIRICVRGWLGGEPTRHVGPNGGRLARFRLGVTPRIYDRGTGEFRDGATQWFSVKAWRDLADNACESLSKGTPVVVRGVLTSESWMSEGAERSTNVITADAIGVDLSTGTAKFTRTVRGSEQAEPGAPGPDAVHAGDRRWDVEAELPEEVDGTEGDLSDEDVPYTVVGGEEQPDAELAPATG